MAFRIKSEEVAQQLEDITKVYGQELDNSSFLKRIRNKLSNPYNKIATMYYGGLFAGIASQNKGKVRFENQKIPLYLAKTTRENFVLKVDGETDENIVFFAHYDSVCGGGINDNKSGVAALISALKNDMQEKPKFGHTYVFCGSEETGKMGLATMLAASAAMSMLYTGLSQSDPAITMAGIALSPSLFMRFGVGGSKAYMNSLPHEDLKKIKAVIAVDTIGCGNTFVVPKNCIGSNMVSAFFPYNLSKELNDTIKQAIYEVGTKKDDISLEECITGGTSDQVSAAEFNKSIFNHEKTEIPAALFCIIDKKKDTRRLNGKISKRKMISPLGYGGVLHTKYDNLENINPETLKTAAEVLNLSIEKLEQGKGVNLQREECFDYASLYKSGQGKFLLCLRNTCNGQSMNSMYLVNPDIRGKDATIGNLEFLHAGTSTIAEEDAKDFGNYKKLDLEKITLDGEITFCKEKKSLGSRLKGNLCYAAGKTLEAISKNGFPALAAAAYLGFRFVTGPTMEFFESSEPWQNIEKVPLAANFLWYGGQVIMNLAIVCYAYNAMAKIPGVAARMLTSYENSNCLKKESLP